MQTRATKGGPHLLHLQLLFLAGVGCQVATQGATGVLGCLHISYAVDEPVRDASFRGKGIRHNGAGRCGRADGENGAAKLAHLCSLVTTRSSTSTIDAAAAPIYKQPCKSLGSRCTTHLASCR